MRASGNHRNHLQAEAIPGSVPALIIHLRTELHSLLTRNREFGQRIHNIRRVMRGLQDMAWAAAPDSPSTTPDSSPIDHIHASPRRPEHYRAPGSQEKSNQMTVSLLRACRIALMETEAAASLDEIYARIVRRGSFLFKNRQRARSTLLRILDAMAQHGEVRSLKDSSLKNGSLSRWERISLVSGDVASRPLHPPPSELLSGMQYTDAEHQASNHLG